MMIELIEHYTKNMHLASNLYRFFFTDIGGAQRCGGLGRALCYACLNVRQEMEDAAIARQPSYPDGVLIP